MTRDEIQKIMDEVPGLNDFGIGVFDQRRKTPEERDKELREGEQTLLESGEDCAKVCAWLKQVDPIKSINDRRSSYGLKHTAENDMSWTIAAITRYVTGSSSVSRTIAT